MTSGDKATVAVLLVVGTILSGWAVVALLSGFPESVEWIKLGCGLLCYAGGCLMLLWPTLRPKADPEPEPEPVVARPTIPAQLVQEVNGYKVEYKILRRSYVSLAAAILATLAALFMIAYYQGNFAAMQPTNNMIVDALTGGMEIAGWCMGLAAALLWAGYAAPVKGLVLAGAILSLLSVLFMLIWVVFSVPVTVLAFIGYARTGKPLAKYVEYQDKQK